MSGIHAGNRSDNMATNKVKRANRFCVIGEKAFNRTWADTVADATTHAAELMRRSDIQELYVVEIKRIVRRRADVDVITVTG